MSHTKQPCYAQVKFSFSFMFTCRILNLTAEEEKVELYFISEYLFIFSGGA